MMLGAPFGVGDGIYEGVIANDAAAPVPSVDETADYLGAVILLKGKSKF